MLEWIISSSALIAVVVLLRFVLKGKISLRLQYALWALVLVRLLLPIFIGSSALSIMNPVENSQIYQEVAGPVSSLPATTVPDLSVGENTLPVIPNTGTPPVSAPDSGTSQGSGGQVEQNTPSLPDTPTVPDVPPVQDPAPVPDIVTIQTVDWQAVLGGVWIAGILLFGAWFAVTNLLFASRVRKNRTALQTEHRVSVYVCSVVDTPCLFGLLRPAIYLTAEVATDERTMRHAVEHELTHYRHGDHIWAILRCVCLAVHWYNPLVWLAALLSKNDAELSCDESTIRRLGESERAEYGRTLLRLTCEKRTHIMTTATTMTGSGKTIKERIALIVRKPKMALYTLIAVLLIAAIAVACTFTGAEDKADEGDDPSDNITEDSGTEDGGDTEDNGDTEGGETEISAEIAYVRQLLETLKTEDVTGYSANMQADTEIIVPLVNAAAATYAGEYEMDYEWEWHVDLHLAERNDDSGHDPALIGFHIGISEGIVDVSCRLNRDTDPSDYVYIRLHSEELWNYIFSLYNPGGIDQHALALYEEILAERAAQTMEYHNTTMVERGFPAFTGFEITWLRLVDSFHYGYSFRVYSFDIAYLTDDPDPGRYGWPQDARPDEQGRIRGYDLSSYFVAAHAHDDLVDYGYLMDYEGYCLPLNLRMDAVESITGEKIRLDYKRAEDGGNLYTCDGASISISYNFEHLVEAHRDSDTWCYGLIMNPTYYLENPYLTDQTLFNLFHLCEYNEDGSGLIFSIRRYTEEEYQTMYLNSYSRQQVFARDDTYYYCVFIPTGTSDEDPETAEILAELLNQQLEKILASMIELNGWRAYAGGEESEPRFSDMSVVPTNYHQIFDIRMQEVMNRHNETCEERNQCAFTGYQFLTFDLKDTFTRDGAEYLIYHWEVAFLTNDPNADESSWVGSTFVDDQNRINYYDTDTFFVVCREKDHFKWDFFHYDLYSDPQDIVFDLLAEHFAALEVEEQELYIGAHNRLSNLTAEDIKAVFDDDSHRQDAPELAEKISAAMEHHIVWPTGGVFPWNLRVYLSGGPDSYNSRVDEYMTLSVYERENIVNIRYHSKDGEHVTLVCEDEALYWYIRRLCDDEVETLPVLTLSDKENETICTAVMNNLKTGWWKNGVPVTDCTYEAGVFQCVYRESADYTDRLYGYAGYFRFDENGNSVEYWYSASIITLSTETGEVINIWWPGDGADYESDILSHFPEEIRDLVAEPNVERYQAVLAQLEAAAKMRMVPVTPTEAEMRLATLTAGDIKHTAGFSEVDAAEVAALLNAAVKNRIDRQENMFFFWTLEVYLSGGPAHNTGTDEWLKISAGQVENIVLITHHSEAGEYTFLYCEDEALYRFVRGTYTTEEFVDEEAYERYGDILRARAQETVDQSREEVDELCPLPYTGYEIVYLKLVETFEKDGAKYEVYKWYVAFLHDDPVRAGLAGGMWIDSELRIRDRELQSYFVACISGDTVEHDFFFYDLYFGPDEETGRENAHETIVKRFKEEA